MAKTRTNSNSITSILTAALNQESAFRSKLLKLFEKKVGRKISTSVQFYDSTHSPLLYEEMKGTAIDIIARVPGQHKPIMMIEVKANIGEPLQKSQQKNGTYQKTAEAHGIPLIYIIPKNYVHEDKLPKKTKKIILIYWEDIYENCENIKISFDEQISQFVDLSVKEEISDEEKKLLKNKKLLLRIFKLKTLVLDAIDKVLKSNNRQTSDEEDQWGVGSYYQWKNNNYFLGFNPYYSNENEEYFLALDIAETCKNYELGDRKKNPLYFEDGYYFLPILNSDILEGDEKVLSAMRERLKELTINKIDNDVKENFFYFYSLRSKIGEEEFKNIFVKKDDDYQLDEKKYEKLLKKI